MYPYTSSCNCDEVHANIMIVICLGMYLHTSLQHHQNQQFLDTLRIGAFMQVNSWFSLPEHCTLSNTICPLPKYVERFTSVTITVAKLLSLRIITLDVGRFLVYINALNITKICQHEHVYESMN